MKTIGEVSSLSGVSIRTLHHYDTIGLLHPSARTDTGYRLYSDSDLQRLQNILLFRELEFPLRQIKAILDAPNFDIREALRQQISLLQIRKNRIEKLITLANTLISKGEHEMNFKAFDKSQEEQYRQEVKERWGNTDAYKEYEKKNRNTNGSPVDELMNQFAAFGKIKNEPADSVTAQTAVKNLQDYITENFYTCTREILQSLGEMYVGDERFRLNIDSAGGEGTAEFVKTAIDIFCR